MTSRDAPDRSKRATRDNLKRALGELDRLTEELSIPSETKGTATRLYRKLLQESSDEGMNGLSIEAVAAACLYLACKTEQVPRNAEEFTSGEGASKKQLLRRAKTIRSELGIDYEGFTDPSKYIERYCDEFELGEEVKTRAKEIAEYAQEAGVAGGKSVQGQAAAAVYNAARERDEAPTQSEMSDVCDVTAVTIRNRYQEQREIIQENEQPPESPEDSIDWVSELNGTDEDIIERAHKILECGREEGLPVDEDEIRWALGALRLASKENDSPISQKTLNMIGGVESSEIRSACDELKHELKNSTSYIYQS